MGQELNVAIATATLALGVAACGSGGDEPTATTETAGATATTQTNGSSGGTTQFLGATLAAATAGEPGVVVRAILSGSASRLQVGDVIVAVNGTPVSSPQELIRTAGSPDIGGHFTIRVVRGSHRLTLHELVAPTAYLGTEVKDATSGVSGPVVVSIVPGGPAAKAQLQPGDVITAVDATRVRSGDDLLAAIATHGPGDTVTIDVQRGSRKLEVSAKLAPRPTP